MMLRTSKDILGENSGKIFENKETWWFNKEVQTATEEKKKSKERWEEAQLEENWIAYKYKNMTSK